MRKKIIIVSIVSTVLLTNMTLSVIASDCDENILPSDDVTETEEDVSIVSFEENEDEEEENDTVEITLEEDKDEISSDVSDFSAEEMNSPDDFLDNSNLSIQTNEKMVGSYIPSSADYNVPVYDSGISTYSNLPVSYPDDMTSFYNKYPGNRNQNLI